MAAQRLILEMVEEDDYQLIAIHCSVPSYRLAFLLNQNIGLQFARKEKDIFFEFSDMTACFPFYQYHDEYQYNSFSLIGNKYRTKVVRKAKNSEGLFTTTIESSHITKYLVPELKKVDYFLKIETETLNFPLKSLIANMVNIPQIITAYTVDYTQLKSKNNLIFE